MSGNVKRRNLERLNKHVKNKCRCRDIQAIATAAKREVHIVAASLEWIRLEKGLADFTAPFVGERFIQDISRAQQDLSYQPTPLEEWLRVTVD